MAAIVLIAAVVGLQRANQKIQDARCPLLPAPELEGHSPFSYAVLKDLMYSWADREAALTIILRALLSARQNGLVGCWAGPVTAIPRVRIARDEAKWVTKKLIEARDYCRANGVKQMKNKYTKLRKPRQVMDSYPPSLLDLPFPIPRPPTLNRLDPVVDLPPPATASDEPGPGEELPAYTKELGEGEQKL